MNQVNKEFKGKQRNQWRDRLPHISLELLEIITCCLEFNPYFRSSAAEIIKDKWFDDIRLEDIEHRANAKLQLEVDRDENFDYEIGEALLYTQNDLNEMIAKTVAAVRECRNNEILLM